MYGFSGKVGDIDAAHGHGYRFVVDDGTGLITVEYEGSMRGTLTRGTMYSLKVFLKE